MNSDTGDEFLKMKPRVREAPPPTSQEKYSLRPRRLSEITPWQEYHQCLSDPEVDRYPCWQADMSQGEPAGPAWQNIICCNGDTANDPGCSTTDHYCFKDHKHKDLQSDLDIFDSDEVFQEYLPLVMTMAPADLKTCGLEGQGFAEGELPVLHLEDGKLKRFRIDRDEESGEVPFNTVCKIRVNSNI